MFKDMTRSRVIQLWFAAVVMIAVAMVAFGASSNLGTWAALFALSLAPPAILLLLWPAAEPESIGDVLRNVDRGV